MALSAHFLTLAVLTRVGIFGQIAACGQTSFTDKTGSIFSPNFPGRYSSNISCQYKISNPGQWLRITWDSLFDIDGKMPYCFDDYIEVFIGCGNLSTSVSRFCSRNAGKPHPIYAKDGCAKLVFYSRVGSPGGQGFKANYEAKSLSVPFSTQKCSSDLNIYNPSGVVFSPGWPVGYQSSYLPHSGECDWSIRQMSSKRIVVNIMDMDLLACAGCYSYSDKLEIQGNTSSVSSNRPTYKYCLQDRPVSIITDYYDLEIDFETNYFSPKDNRRGFVVGFIAYTDDSAETVSNIGADKKGTVATVTNIGAVFVGVISVIFVIIVVILFVRWFKRRRATRGYVQARPCDTAGPAKSSTSGVFIFPVSVVSPPSRILSNDNGLSADDLHSRPQVPRICSSAI